MKNSILKLTAIFGLTTVLLNSCGPKDNPPLVYFPDMYFPVAYDPLMKAKDAYSDHENEIPAFVARNGETGLSPVEGTVSQNKDGIVSEETLPKNVDEYNAGYDASKSITTSPLKPENLEKDLARGKVLFDHTCSACHGTGGDGQGPIVQSGAYSGVPNYADRDITIGSIHYVLTNGRNAMGSYAGQLNVGDRWRVALYVYNTFKAPSLKTAPATAAPAATEKTSTAPAAAEAKTNAK
ncbi:Cytochrome c, mono-and diheme variants [Epilithonimonas pallida]|uniref:Cytochrome c, mono-and diheme variants n=2 Tax=Epilithonimonas pallida TaxID=373671 RepID=A0ABY1R1C8_9FLAO|nr:Cytochrome c, mono-and diheme variants [Epilithonimonas pallida]